MGSLQDLTTKLTKILLLPVCGLGDAVCYLPCLFAIRRKHPDAYVTVVVASEAAKKVLESAQCNMEIIVFARGSKQDRWIPLLNLLRNIRRTKYDIVLSGAHLNSIRVPLFSALSGAKIRAGAKMERFSFLYNVTIDVRTDAHAYERFRRLLIAVGVEMSAREYIPHLRRAPEVHDSAMALWDQAKVGDGQPVVGIVSGADTINRGPWRPYLKRWSSERYAEVVQWLVKEVGAKVVMFGGKDESELAQQIAERAGVPLVSFCGRTNIQELAWLVNKCTILITNDTGVMHLTAAAGTPLLMLFGPTDSDTVAPIGEQHRIVQGRASCSPCYPFPTCNLARCAAMDDISIEQVKAVVMDLLNVGERSPERRLATTSLIQIRTTPVSVPA